MADGRRRLDAELVERGLARSRSQAADLIRRRLVRVGGRQDAKPSMLVAASDPITVDRAAAGRVSRAGEKLEHALRSFSFRPEGRHVLDLGASTGGFTEEALRQDAARVYAVDVGHGQLAPALKADQRVVDLEGRDARHLTDDDIPERVGAIVADLSFISAAKALERPLRFAAPGAWLVVLVKPQFEVGRDRIGKRGLVSDAESRMAAVADFERWLAAQTGWTLVGRTRSPLPGKDGNEEWLVGAVRDI